MNEYRTARKLKLVSAWFAAGLVALFGSQVRGQDTLIVGADVGANPYIIGNPDGTITGLNVDLVEEAAKRLGRAGVKVIDQQFSGIFAGLEAKKYEFIAAPVTLTQQRSEAMLFIEGFIATDLQFLTRNGRTRARHARSTETGRPSPSTTARRRSSTSKAFAINSASRSASTERTRMPFRPCCPAAMTPRSAATAT